MKKPRIRIVKKYSAEPMSEAQWQESQRILARLVARAYLADLEAKSDAEGAGASERGDGDSGDEEALEEC